MTESESSKLNKYICNNPPNTAAARQNIPMVAGYKTSADDGGKLKPIPYWLKESDTVSIEAYNRIMERVNAYQITNSPLLICDKVGSVSEIPEVLSEQFKAIIKERDDALAHVDELRRRCHDGDVRILNLQDCLTGLEQRLAASEDRTKIMLKHYHIVCDRLRAKERGIVEQVTIGDDTYTVFAKAPMITQVDKKHTPADVKPPMVAPKPFPAGALKTPVKDNRRIGS